MKSTDTLAHLNSGMVNGCNNPAQCCRAHRTYLLPLVRLVSCIHGLLDLPVTLATATTRVQGCVCARVCVCVCACVQPGFLADSERQCLRSGGTEGASSHSWSSSLRCPGPHCRLLEQPR